MVEKDTTNNDIKQINIQEEIGNHPVITQRTLEGYEKKQEKMVRYANELMWIKAMKIFIFFALSGAVLTLYAIDMTYKFHNDASTFTTKTVEADDFQMPPIVICMQNGMKPTTMKKYGLATAFDFSFDPSVKNISSVWDAFVEGSYLVNRDFSMKGSAITNFGKTNEIVLSNGFNFLKTENKSTIEIVVTQHHTMVTGTCYEIKSNVSVPPFHSVSIFLMFNQSINNADLPKVCNEFLWFNRC